MRLIGFSGKKNSGKNTAAYILIKAMGYKELMADFPGKVARVKNTVTVEGLHRSILVAARRYEKERSNN